MQMQHYATFLQGFNYEIQYRRSEDHANADCLSRLSVRSDTEAVVVVDAFLVEAIDTLPVTVNRIAQETEKDNELRDLLYALQSGKQIHRSKRFQINQTEFSLQQGVIMRGHKAVIPKI